MCVCVYVGGGGGLGGGLQNGSGARGFLPLWKGGGGGGSFSHIGGAKGGWAQKVLSCLGGGVAAQNVSDQQLSHFVAPLPIINDQSLKLGIQVFHIIELV